MLSKEKKASGPRRGPTAAAGGDKTKELRGKLGDQICLKTTGKTRCMVANQESRGERKAPSRPAKWGRGIYRTKKVCLNTGAISGCWETGGRANRWKETDTKRGGGGLGGGGI